MSTKKSSSESRLAVLAPSTVEETAEARLALFEPDCVGQEPEQNQFLAHEQEEQEIQEDGEVMCTTCGGLPDLLAQPGCCDGCYRLLCGKIDSIVSLRFGDVGAEQLTAELEIRATAEAEQLVAADGSICKSRLRFVKAAFGAAYTSRVLSRIPFTSLLCLDHEDWDPDAFNTSLLLEDFREMRLWRESPASARSVFPVRLHSLFEEADLEAQLTRYKMLVPEDFVSAHPKLQAATAPVTQSSTRNGKSVAQAIPPSMASFAEFKAVLRSFSGGLLENVPLHPARLILGGSCMPACVRPLSTDQRRLCRAEARATALEMALMAKLSKQLGTLAATKIMWLAAGHDANAGSIVAGDRWPHLGAQGLRHTISAELFGDPAWEDADIDLFVVGDNASDTVKEVVTIVQQNIGRLIYGRESVVLRTSNTLTVVGGWPFRNVQIVCKTVRCAQELLVHADVDCSAMAYDGERVLAATRALRSLASGFNFIPKQILMGSRLLSKRSVARFSKYYLRGVGVLVFEHCRHFPRCDHQVDKDALVKLKKFKMPKAPKLDSETPEKKGMLLAKWMLSQSIDLRRKKKSSDDAGADVDDLVNDVRTHRLVPGHSAGPVVDGSDERKNSGDLGRTGPFRNYSGFTDIVIPNSRGVCAETLRAYVRALDLPQILQEVETFGNVTTLPKTTSDRLQWQDKMRGKCYMCNVAVQTKKPRPLCLECSDFNTRKCRETTDCFGMVAVVTGGRIKIGRECALRLLRSGATVLVTSRFPRATIERYRQEVDYDTFAQRLFVCAADFRKLVSVQSLLTTIQNRFDRVDILIHNAAQTIRRPLAYYESILRREQELAEIANEDHLVVTESVRSSDSAVGVDTLSTLPLPNDFATLAPDMEAEDRKAEWFPVGCLDAHGEQLDLRTVTSWTAKLEDTEMPELIEVLAVNLVVPYILTARLLPLLRQAPCAFVVFVSSQEGAFTRAGEKGGTHPHTNIAKAGLNMLAKTIAGDFKKERIFASVVDPGWVSSMQPVSTEAPPLTETDGAARVLDPVFSGMKALKVGRSPPSGVFYKDFRVSPW